MSRIKRKRGGQPGNQNARTHGYYSRTMLPAELADLPRSSRVPGLDAEIALLRCRLKSVSHCDASNSEPLLRIITQLRLALQVRHRLLRNK
jgi:hypothetical protein